MQHSFFQKLILVVLAGALVAGVYVYVYKGIIVSSMDSVYGGYSTSSSGPATPRPTPRRY